MDDRPKKPGRKRHRASRAALAARHKVAEDLLSVGIPHCDVVRQVADKYEITERQAENYVSTVYARWRRQAPPDDGSRRDQLIKMAHTVYIAALQGEGKGKGRDLRSANQSLQILIRLYGVGPGVAPVDFLANLPQDKDRFSGDRNYQILTTMRDQLARLGAAGDNKAAAEAAKISASISELYGVSKGAVTTEQEARAVAAAKRVLINSRYFGETDPAAITDRIDDFAHEQEKPKEEDDA